MRDSLRKRPEATETLRLVIVRNAEGGIVEVLHDNPRVKVVPYVADEDLSNADQVRTVIRPGQVPVPMDIWTFDAHTSKPQVEAFMEALGESRDVVPVDEPEPEPVVERPAPVHATEAREPEPPGDAPAVEESDEDNPNCDYCGEFIGYGLRQDFPVLACAKCDGTAAS